MLVVNSVSVWRVEGRTLQRSTLQGHYRSLRGQLKDTSALEDSSRTQEGLRVKSKGLLELPTTTVNEALHFTGLQLANGSSTTKY